MMRFLRSQSQTVLVIILVVIGASFIFYGNVGSLLTGSSGRAGDYGKIDGQDLSVAELYQAVRTTHDALTLNGQEDELNQPGGRAALAEEAWRQLLILHEADRLHIQVTDQELLEYIQHLPFFQKNGVYSPDLYQTEMSNLQNRFRISPDAFETVLRNSLRTDAVTKALFATVRTGAKDLPAQYEKFFGPTQVSVVTFDPKSLAPTMQVNPAEIAAEYKAHPDNPNFRTPEKRKVDYVLLSLTPEQMKLPAKDKSSAIEALGEKALDFALIFQPEPNSADSHAPVSTDFQGEAKKKGLSVKTTDYFAADAPPGDLPPSPAFNNSAFSLTKENPISKVVELDNGVAVLHLNDIQPSELRPLDQVKGEITQQLQQSKATQQVQFTAQIAAAMLRGGVNKGLNFAAAAAAQKLPVETIPVFVPAKLPQQADARTQTIAYASTELAVGATSPPTPVQGSDAVLLIHVDSRAPADPSGLADFEARYREKQDQQVRKIVYVDWANWMSRQAGTHRPPDLEQYGGVE